MSHWTQRRPRNVESQHGGTVTAPEPLGNTGTRLLVEALAQRQLGQDDSSVDELQRATGRGIDVMTSSQVSQREIDTASHGEASITAKSPRLSRELEVDSTPPRATQSTRIPDQEDTPNVGTAFCGISEQAPPPYVESSTQAPPEKRRFSASSDGTLSGDGDVNSVYHDVDARRSLESVISHETHLDEEAPLPSYMPSTNLSESAPHHIIAPLASESTTGRLARPIVLPQRRPQYKSRGFVRAYSPALKDCGIDQSTFMWFLDALDREMTASAVFHVSKITAVASTLPLPLTATLIRTAHISLKKAKYRSVGRKTDKFMDRMNTDLFAPHGLYCMIVAGEMAASISNVDSVEFMRESDLSRTTSVSKALEASPALRRQSSSGSSTKPPKKSGWARSQDFIAEYNDKRAQA